MLLKVLGSGSSGNCYILENDTEALIIEAGVPLKDVKIALGFNIRKIVGVVATHSHKDHSGYIEQYKKAGISAHCLGEIFPEYDAENMKHYLVRKGRFEIRIFPLIHDVPCYGFHISHPDIGNLIYASDTEYIKYRFKNLNHILVEANYSDDLVEGDAVNREHVLRGHMSLKTALDFISTNDNPTLKNVVLIHLSASNSDADYFLQKTKETVKYGTDCYIAEKGREINLDLIPF